MKDKDSTNDKLRFEFGKNWKNFLSVLNEERISEAEKSLREMLECDDLNGKSFLDVGSGSGLFSLAAKRMGAKVHSFDIDPESVACAQQLKLKYFPNDNGWHIEKGSVIDTPYIQSLNKFDIVYSWGVLHHTGDMWKALENVSLNVKDNGKLFIAIYNDVGLQSRFWYHVKKNYCSGYIRKAFICVLFIPILFIKTLEELILKKKNIIKGHQENRGMSFFYEWFDWLGGFPFEVARVEQIFNFYRKKGFALFNLKTSYGGGNNQFVFLKD